MKTIEEITVMPVEIVLNNYKYYIPRAIIDRYFRNATVDRKEFINVDKYTLGDDTHGATKKLCNILALEINDSFSCEYFNKYSEITQKYWPLYFMFLHKYLKISEEKLSVIISMIPCTQKIKDIYIGTIEMMYNCKDPIKYYSEIYKTFCKCMKQCSNGITKVDINLRDKIHHGEIRIAISPESSSFALARILLNVGNINVVREAILDQGIDRNCLEYLGLDPTEFDKESPVYY